MQSVDSTNSLLARALGGGHSTDPYRRMLDLLQEPGWLTQPELCESELRASPVPLILTVADQQTQCRGRLGRSWYNKAGQSLLASWAAIVPTRLLTGDQSGWCSMAVGMAVIDGLREAMSLWGATALAGHEASAEFLLKWPNDIYCDGHKLAGILCETLPLPGDYSILIAGLGLNVFIPQAELPTPESTSLQLLYGPLPVYLSVRNQLAFQLSLKLSQELTKLVADSDVACGELHKRVCQCSWTLGRRVMVSRVDGSKVVGTALDIASDASLRVQPHTGECLSISTGDVGLIPSLTGSGSPQGDTS